MIYTSDEIRATLEEYQRRQEHQINVFKPTQVDGHNQVDFLKATTRYKLLLGGNQSGKSHTAAYDLACYARGRHPYISESKIPKGDIAIWVISAEYITIKTGIFRHLKNIIPKWDLLKEGPRVPGHQLPSYLLIRRKDSSICEITFMSAKGENREKFQAEAVTKFYIDEEISGDIVEELEARTIVTGGNFTISATLVESHEWLTSLERRAERGDKYVSLTRLDTTKNPYVDQEALNYFSANWSDETKQYRLYGKSRRSTGLVFNTWNRHRHEVPPFKIPQHWPRWCAIDPGIRTCAVLWIAVDETHHAYAYRELYAHNEPLWTIAKKIREAERWVFNHDLSHSFGHYVFEETDESEHMVNRIIDDKVGSRLITGQEGVMGQLYSRYGILCSPADKAKAPGIEDCRYWLEPLADGKPGFVVFNHLINFIEERANYRIRDRKFKKDQNEPIDEPVKRRDHLMDDWRYLAREKPRFIEREEEPRRKPSEILARQRETEHSHEFLGSNW